MESRFIDSLVYYLTSPEIQSRLFELKIVFLFFGVIFLIGAIYFFLTSSYLRFYSFEDLAQFFSWQAYGFGKMMKRWRKISERIEVGLEGDYKLAIIEADDFLNETLEKKGYTGKSFEERIKKAEEIPSVDMQEVLKVHQTRNSIVYDPDYKLEPDQAKKVIETYKQAIQNLETF